MSIVISRDGTAIGYEQLGNGPALILVDGALCSRAFGPMTKLASHLANDFRVFTFDRRGRGESGDTQPYSVEREVEDLGAVVEAAGGEALLYGISSGGALALEAAKQIPGIRGVVVYEVPFIVDDSREPIAEEYWNEIANAVAAGNRGRAVKLFLKSVGVPAAVLAVFPLFPVWSRLKAAASTLPNDGALVRRLQLGRALSVAEWQNVKAPTHVSAGGKSPAWLRTAMKSLTAVLPRAEYSELAGQTHNVSAKAIAPVIAAFGARTSKVSQEQSLQRPSSAARF